MILVGLRVDVDTLRGTRIGVPNLVSLFKEHNIHASFFFSLGPDNMGRHIWRLLRPAFLLKMLRSKAVSLYGWDILLRGTIWPGPVIGDLCPDVLRECDAAGHEMGIHAWDHYQWQTQLDKMNGNAVTTELMKSVTLFKHILGKEPVCFAAPGWRISKEALQTLEYFNLTYISVCRGNSIFHPFINGQQFKDVEIPTTLPTYDELIGKNCTRETYNDYLLDLIKPDQLNVLTIHAEAEGISCISLFKDFIEKAEQRGIEFKPLGHLINSIEKTKPASIKIGDVDGRDGWVSIQTELNSKKTTHNEHN